MVSLSRTEMARRRCGGRAHRRWRLDSPIMSGACAKCCWFASRRGHSRRRF